MSTANNKKEITQIRLRFIMQKEIINFSIQVTG